MTITGSGLIGRSDAPAATAAPATPAASAAASLAVVRERVEAMARLGIWRMELRTGRVAWSPEMYRILGLDPESAEGPTSDTLDLAVVPADRGRYADAMTAAIGSSRGVVECRLLRPDGETAWVRVGAERERDADGRDIALVGYVQELAQLDAAGAALGIAAGSGLAPGSPAPGRPATVRKPAAPIRVSAGVVLLVEDEDAVRNALGRMLGSLGFSVLEASTGDEALELIGYDQEDGIDLVVTDIRMPGVSGPELAQRIRAVRDVPVLFVSGYSADLAEDIRSARRTHILDKPFDAESLAEAIRTLLAQDA